MELVLGNSRFRYFSKVNISLRYDAIASTFSLSANFDPNNPLHKFLFQPLGYSICELWHNGQQLLEGPMLNHEFKDEAVDSLIKISGYSTTGVLEDCPIPVFKADGSSNYPLQMDGLTLRQVIEKVISPYSISLSWEDELLDVISQVYETTQPKPAESCKQYLDSICSQRNIVLSHTATGDLRLKAGALNDKVVAHFEPGDGVCTTYQLKTNGQKMHSSITVLKQVAAEGGNNNAVQGINDLVGLYRPHTVMQTSGDDIASEDVGRAARSSELKGIALKLELDRWEVDGQIIMPGDTITVKNPECYLYNRTKWTVQNTDLELEAQKETCTLTAVLPEVFNGQTPQNIFE